MNEVKPGNEISIVGLVWGRICIMCSW